MNETPSLQITPAVVFMHACVTTSYSLSGFRPPSVHCNGPPGGIVQVAFSELLVTMVTSKVMSGGPVGGDVVPTVTDSSVTVPTPTPVGALVNKDQGIIRLKLD